MHPVQGLQNLHDPITVCSDDRIDQFFLEEINISAATPLCIVTQSYSCEDVYASTYNSHHPITVWSDDEIEQLLLE